jgi:hypothetical protein
MPKNLLMMITPIDDDDPDDLEYGDDDADDPDVELLATCFEGVAQAIRAYVIRRTGK